MLGRGLYFSTNAVKSGQYQRGVNWHAVDRASDVRLARLYRALYGTKAVKDVQTNPQGRIFYVLLTRVVLGDVLETDNVRFSVQWGAHTAVNLQRRVLGWKMSEPLDSRSIIAGGCFRTAHCTELQAANPASLEDHPAHTLVMRHSTLRYPEVVKFHPDVYVEGIVAYERVSCA